ncbi:MAG: ergothioneine biosynthesis protein EgtB [Chitinophagaceae bacterium]|jgi:ergothioneine biosynthesis protein EgtB|nr:ergothioneine biosynthesis protein EgtB [Chitinophagaceae bacterium]
MEKIKEKFKHTRQQTENICKPLYIEDYSVQPIEFVSPPKWHLGHVTWFWEEFVLKQYKKGYKEYNADFSYLFNSYYNTVGKRVLRPTRGLMTRPSVNEVFAYRNYVTNEMLEFLETQLNDVIRNVVEIGINHEEQHQELLIYDIKYILGHQPLFPAYDATYKNIGLITNNQFLTHSEGVYEIGHIGNGFCFDNELNRHKVYVNNFEIAKYPVLNKEYLDFINDGGYTNFNYWHDEGWHWINTHQIKAPLYWHLIDGEWHEYDLNGLHPLNTDTPVTHVSYYEAFAFAQWKNMRLPTEAEWEVAAPTLAIGNVWEWTNSAYLAYPGYNKAPGALGEYNGKFMVNQMVLRGASYATPLNHSRISYRNFFHANMRWQYAGIRLVK